jgi:hypothetical protein
MGHRQLGATRTRTSPSRTDQPTAETANSSTKTRIDDDGLAQMPRAVA